MSGIRLDLSAFTDLGRAGELARAAFATTPEEGLAENETPDDDDESAAA